MYAYITTCCKKKSTEKGDIPMLERYLSERIQCVYKQSKNDNVTFFVLSGKYGLLSPADKILWYDKVLDEREVNEMSEIIAKQLKNYGITEVTMFVKPEWNTYIDTLKLACKLNAIPFTLSKID